MHDQVPARKGVYPKQIDWRCRPTLETTKGQSKDAEDHL